MRGKATKDRGRKTAHDAAVWRCQMCGHVNYGRVRTCSRCSRGLETLSKAIYETVKPLDIHIEALGASVVLPRVTMSEKNIRKQCRMAATKDRRSKSAKTDDGARLNGLLQAGSDTESISHSVAAAAISLKRLGTGKHLKFYPDAQTELVMVRKQVASCVLELRLVYLLLAIFTGFPRAAQCSNSNSGHNAGRRVPDRKNP